MASHIPYVARRGPGLAFRRRVPLRARTVYGKSFFAFSLRTHVMSEARRRATIGTRFTDDLIGLIEACGADMLEDRQIDAVIDTLMRVEIETVEALREDAGPRSADAATTAVRVHEATRETLRAARCAALNCNDCQAVHAPLERSFARLGIAPAAAGDGWQRIGRRAARVLIEVAGENIRREQGIYASDSRLDAAQSALVTAQAMPVLPAPPVEPVPAPASVTHSPNDTAMAPPPPARSSTPESPETPPASCRARKTSVTTPAPRPDVEARRAGTGPARRPGIVRRAGTADDPFAVNIAELDDESPFSDWFAAAVTVNREQAPG